MKKFSKKKVASTLAVVTPAVCSLVNCAIAGYNGIKSEIMVHDANLLNSMGASASQYAPTIGEYMNTVNVANGCLATGIAFAVVTAFVVVADKLNNKEKDELKK